ncbi:MAG: PAS domain S-box protein [Fibrobacterota bacterium]|nr:PAS domain S-box protein [Fibrobacterota bacterium]QQS06294.1 MAG: PAS domain S-box protein [Fibrobacterota bacterium]
MDDDVEVLQGLVAALSVDFFPVRPALGGAQAMEAIAGQPPELIVSRSRMPDLDGFEICRRVKANPSTKDIPILLTSQVIDPLERLQGFHAGVVDFLQQPFLPQELLARVRLHLESTRLLRHTGLAASPLTVSPPPNEVLWPPFPDSERNPTSSEQSLRGMIHELGIFNKVLLDTTKGLILVLDLDGCIVQFNHACEVATGWREEEILGADYVKRFLPAPQHEEFRRIFRDLCQQKIPSNRESECLRRDGTTIWVSWANSVILDESGRVKFIVKTGMDRSEQRKSEREIIELNANLEKRVAERTSELQLANQELESFSYSVSHDLRAPLRSIDGYAKALEEDFHEILPNDAKSHLHRIRTASHHMGSLIDDLLELSRSIRSPLHRAWVNLSTIATEILDSLKATDPARVCKLDVHPSLASWSDPVLTRVLLQNLLDNAWKYTSTTTNPSISLYPAQIDGCEWIVVEDNGVGFDMEYAPRLFKTFQRLHTNSQFPGTGVGLATVKRIVQRHGGAIFGQGFPNRGAIFKFNLGGQGFKPS